MAKSDKDDITLEYINRHKLRVKQWMNVFINELKRRADIHDNSKLEEPELSGWKAMDKEPRYKYGTPEYNDKVNRYKWLMELHWRRNRHHPEYWQIWEEKKDRDLLDYIEMLIDWLSYTDRKMSYTQARNLVKRQISRYHMNDLTDEINNPPMSQLLLNTLSNYFVTIGGPNVDDEIAKEKKEKERLLSNNFEKGQFIDIYI